MFTGIIEELGTVNWNYEAAGCTASNDKRQNGAGRPKARRFDLLLGHLPNRYRD